MRHLFAILLLAVQATPARVHVSGLPARFARAPGLNVRPVPLVATPEASECYRLLGLAEDASYNEIEAAFNELVTRSNSDPKRRIKLQIAKDKILEDRLRQRMSGTLRGTAPINPFERPEAPKPLITIPPFLADVMELPSRDLLKKNAFVFGVISLLPFLARTWASTSVSLGFAVGLYSLYNRGLPDTTGQMGGEMRPPKVRPLVLASGITFIAGAIGATVSQLAYGLVRRLLAQEIFIALCTSLAFFTSATLFKVQDE